MEVKKVKPFPKDFLWGSATSSFQCEGAANMYGKGASVIDKREVPEGQCNYDIASDHYHHYKEDVALMKELGLKAYRFSISWTRIFPSGSGIVNEEGVTFYNNLINELVNAGIEPIVTIYHFDYPQGLVDKYGGWISRESINDYVNYAEFLFKTYGDRVKLWLTINEQDHVVHMPYRLGMASTNRKETEKLGFQANHHMCVATALVIQKCHEIVNESKIGPAVCFDMMYPTSNNPNDVLAWIDAMDIRNYYILDLHCEGRYNKIIENYLIDRDMFPIVNSEDLNIMKDNKPDFIAFNYYASKSVSSNPTTESKKIGDIDFKLLPHAEAGIYKIVKNDNLSATLWGWEIDEIGIRVAMRLLYDKYNLPLLITENGFGAVDKIPSNENEMIIDDDRIDYLKKHIQQIKEAINDGVSVMGYCNWSFIDVISGHSGFSKRYGLVYVNRDDIDLKDCSRHKKKSFYWYKKVIDTNGEVLE